jgi:hypothetical protein
VTPDSPLVTARASFWTWPGKIFTLMLNLLEINRNGPYHDLSGERGCNPESKKGGEFYENSPPALFLTTE